jgi:hypothetical protein
MKTRQITAYNIYNHAWQILALAAFALGLFVSYSLAGDDKYDSPPATAQTVIKGEWTAELRRDKEDKIQFSLSRRTANGNHNMSNSDYTIPDFQGLSKEQMLGNNVSVRFSLPREAGNFECEGTFKDGRGVGFFTLRRNGEPQLPLNGKQVFHRRHFEPDYQIYCRFGNFRLRQTLF